MNTARIARAENGTLEDPTFQRAMEATRPKIKTRILLVRDFKEPPPAKPGESRILVRVITTGRGRAPATARERVLRPGAPTLPTSPAMDQGKNDRPATAKPEAEMTIPELEAELARLEAEILMEERRPR